MAIFGARRVVVFRLVLAVGLVTGWSVRAAPVSAENQERELAWFSIFQKAATWPETLLVSRTRYRKWRALERDGTPFNAVDLALRYILASDPAFAVYKQRVTRDWAQLRLPQPRTGELQTVTPLDWFNSTETRIERGLIHLVLNRMQSDCRIASLATAPFRKRLATLERDGVSPDDTRWLELYCTVTDWEKDLERLRGLNTFPDSAELIAREFPGETVYHPNELLGRLEQLGQRWEQLREPLLQAPERARPQVVKLVREYAAVRDRVQFGLRTVEEFLADCQLLDMKTEWQEQFANLNAELQRCDWYQKPAVKRQALRQVALIFDSDRDPTDVVLRRTKGLLNELETGPQGPTLPTHRLRHLEQTANAIAPRFVDARRALFFEICRLRRCIAFSNPLLEFDKILFVKRHFLRWGGGPAQKQYFGYRAHGGGGLFVLHRPFTSQPDVQDVLANSVCENGRLRGDKLAGGDFVSPELSYDARTVFFAYTQHASKPGDPKYQAAQFIDIPRTLENTYHLFRVDVDGAELRQLTDGAYNDVDPCLLPNGRIAFISERRGGYGRSSNDRVYTLHSMNADGTDIVRLSHHETNEWQPSVLHDGKIVYTRWDIWDRGYFEAMNLWVTFPDGRDGRALFGNYVKQSDAPWATMDARSIPGSRKLIGTVSSYFEQSYGALIVIDPSIPDDQQMTKLKRITPEQPFPWREQKRYTGPLDYGTPWPLAELFCLCVYDSDSAVEKGPKNNYGIYLVDAFGNKELLYRDPRISCLSPIPLRPRPKPPTIPHATLVGKPACNSLENGTVGQDAWHQPESMKVGQAPIVLIGASPIFMAGSERSEVPVPFSTRLVADAEGRLREMATVGVIDVYNGYYPFPDDARITGLRIVQVAYKSVSGRNVPVIGYGTGAGLDKGGRMVLGTVPVEEDGSAYFTMPANVPVYFQALDAEGLAVQTMRSVTYAQPGERLVCLGCHEQTYKTPPVPSRVPVAFQRKPSRIKPDVDGSYPLTFPRLVQPVLDTHCVSCHEKHLEKAVSLARGNWKKHSYKFFESYVNLREYVHCFDAHSGDTERTIPGTFGARASKLYDLLKGDHYDVKLTAEELHRVALWIDCNARFFAACRELDKQAEGEIVMPAIE